VPQIHTSRGESQGETAGVLQLSKLNDRTNFLLTGNVFWSVRISVNLHEKKSLNEFILAKRGAAMPMKAATLLYTDYVQGIYSLNQEEQLRLLEIISANLRRTLESKRKKHSIMELEGLGAGIWDGIDAQEYVNKERASWN
jgi:hypothetical protein